MADATQPDTVCSRREALVRGAAMLRAAGVERPAFEARLLLAHAAGMEPGRLLGALDEQPAELAAYEALLRRRARREPVALILGHREFWSLRFEVSADTLIPRPDSEAVVEAALAAAPRDAPFAVLDLGTGTGCLLLAVLSERPRAWGVGVDVAPGAAALAARNAEALGLGGRACFVCGDWGAALACGFDLVLCNPPYIESADISTLMPEVARFEPRRALDGGADGLDAYRLLIPRLGALLAPGGTAVFEAGAGQAASVAEIGRRAGFQERRRLDLAGVERAVSLRRDCC